MTEKTNKWLMGCGIGCGALILVGIIIGAVGYLLVRDTVTEFKGVEESREYLEARFGDVQDFTPDPSGRIEPGLVVAVGPGRHRELAFQLALGCDAAGVDVLEGIRPPVGPQHQVLVPDPVVGDRRQEAVDFRRCGA